MIVHERQYHTYDCKHNHACAYDLSKRERKRERKGKVAYAAVQSDMQRMPVAWDKLEEYEFWADGLYEVRTN